MNILFKATMMLQHTNKKVHKQKILDFKLYLQTANLKIVTGLTGHENGFLIGHIKMTYQFSQNVLSKGEEQRYDYICLYFVTTQSTTTRNPVFTIFLAAQ